MDKYKSKAIFVQAIQLNKTEDSILNCVNFICKDSININPNMKEALIKIANSVNGFYIPWINRKISFGDYIVKHNGDIHIYNANYFENNYELCI